MVTFAFQCNIACTFCMVEDALGVMPGTSLDAFRNAVAQPGRLKGISRIVFSGGEVTLSKELLAYAQFARSLPGIEHVRIQTNAVRLSDRSFLRELIAAGVDEYFVSFHAPEAVLYERIARRPNVFKAIMAGLSNIASEGASLTTNTCIVDSNVGTLPAIVETVAPFSPRSMEFWNYWPRGDEDARRQAASRVTVTRGPLLEALAAADAKGITPVVKWFPRCLLGPSARFLDDSQPDALIDEGYWAQEPGYSCVYEGVCADAGRGCSGLSHAYVRQHGWEDKVLIPRRESSEPESGNAKQTETRSLVKDAGEKRSHSAAVTAWLSRFSLVPGIELQGYTLTGAGLGRGVAMLALHFKGASSSLEIRVHLRDARRSAFARTASYDLLYTRTPPALEGDAQRLTAALAAAISREDRGGQSLPG